MRKAYWLALLLVACQRKPVEQKAPTLAELLARSPRSAEFGETAATLEAQVASATVGFRKQRRPIAAKLDGNGEFHVPVEEGSCYRAVMRLQPGAAFSELAQRGVRFDVTLPDAEGRSSGVVHGPGGIIDLRCANHDGQAVVRMVAVRGTDVAADARSVGSGPVSIQIFERRATAADFTAEDLDAEVAGYEPSGPPLEGQLESPGTFAVTWEKRRCYKLVVRPKSGAAFTARNVKFTWDSPSLMSGAGPGRRGPGALSIPGCQEVTRKMKLRMSPGGHGGFVAQLYSRPASTTEMAELNADIRRAYQDAAAAQGRSQAEACARCAEERGLCRTNGHGENCEQVWLTCVRAHTSAQGNAQAYSTCN